MAEASLGSINRGHLIDYVLDDEPPGGPFPTIKHFNDWFSQLPWNKFTDLEDFEDPYRHLLPDLGAIKLTHGDLHQGNIIVSSTGPPRVLAIVDWAHCGWYPDYWEYCKAAYTCWYNGKWRNKWIQMFLEPLPDTFDGFGEIIRALGVV